MPFLTDETSVQNSAPREGVKIVHGNTTYRISFGVKTEIINGEVYLPLPGKRGELGIASAGQSHQMTFSLQVSHPFAQRYMAKGVPPKRIMAYIYRKQKNSGGTEQIFAGEILSCKVSRQIITFLVESSLSIALSRRIGTGTAGRNCPHALYSIPCGVSVSSYTVTTTVLNTSGRYVTVNSMGGQADYWAQYGELIHDSSGEAMTIFEHIGNLLTIQYPLYELNDGDAVTIRAGCDHSVQTCHTKFVNQVNFGGQPIMPTANPHVGGGLGIYSSE